MLDSGFRISDLNNIPINGKDGKFKNRIALDNTYLLSYAHTIYGINYNKQNYKIPLKSIRDDIKGYIGVESLVAPWSEQLKLWHGNWENSASRNKSYIYQWQTADKLHEHYSPEKFADKENSYFIIKDAPYPFESGELNNRNRGEKESVEISEGNAYANISINTPIKSTDPHPDSNKLVTKAYIDERLSSKRLVEVGTDFYIRDYDCNYIIRAEDISNETFDNCIKIRQPDSFNERILHNKLEFYVLVEGIWDELSEKWIPATSSKTSWKFFDNNDNEVELCWLTSKVREPSPISDPFYYDDVRYLTFKFETVTDDIQADTLTEEVMGKESVAGYQVTASYKVFAACENILYRYNGIEFLNDLNGIKANLKSSDDSVTIVSTVSDDIIDVDLTTIDTITTVECTDGTVDIVKTVDGHNINYNLSAPDKTIIEGDNFISAEETNDTWQLKFTPDTLSPKNYIQKLPLDGEIDLLSAINKTYWTDSASPKILIRNAFSIGNEVVTFSLLLKTTVDTTIDTSSHFIWPNTINGKSPTFIANRLYHITFTNIYGLDADNSPFGSVAGFAKIDWFVDSNIIESSCGWAENIS